MGAAVDLHQHALLGHALAPEPVLLRPATAGAADASLHQDAAHRGPAQVDPLPLPQQLGEVAVVGAGVAVAGQLDHGGRRVFRHGVVGPPSPVAVGQGGGTVLAVGRQKALGVAFTDSHDLGCLPYRKVVLQHGVEYLDSCLFSLFQCHFPHKGDIFAEQLAGDLIVEHQQNVQIYPVNIDKVMTQGFTGSLTHPGSQSATIGALLK